MAEPERLLERVGSAAVDLRRRVHYGGLRPTDISVDINTCTREGFKRNLRPGANWVVWGWKRRGFEK